MKTMDITIQHSVIYGQKTIEYSLLYCDRKTMEIAVHPDNTVIVRAPAQSDIDSIEKKIIKRARWILKQQKYFKQFIPKTPERYYVNGETHLYLGKQYRLKVVKGDENSVKLSCGFFHITCQNEPTPNAAKKLLNQWKRRNFNLQKAWSAVGRNSKVSVLISQNYPLSECQKDGAAFQTKAQ